MNTMTALFRAAFVLTFLSLVVAPPPNRQPPPPPRAEQEINMDSETLALEYGNYLEEIVKTLEEDSKFKHILANATDEEIKSGSVADRLHLVDPLIRSKLDELKRIELDRLRKQATEVFERSNGLDRESIKEPLHLEHRNPHTFREEDLRKLIHKTTKDLEDMDKSRRDDFKKYEMEKEFDYQEKLKAMDEEHKKEMEKKHEEEKNRVKEHPQVHHPFSEDQLEEVWEDADHMSKQDFDPVTFFHMHDVDGNEVLDQLEVMALFKSELDKLYNGSDYDQHEREEEMNEMREATFAEVDTDRDGFISLKEFLASTKHNDYQQDQGWEAVNERQQFQRPEYEQYERQRMAEIQRQINMGVMPPPHMGYQTPPGYGSQPGQGQPPVPPSGFMPPHAPQMQQPGMAQPGMAQPGMAQPGMAQPGMAQPQFQQPQFQQPGMAQPQMQQPGMAQPQFQQPGMAQPQLQQPGMAQPQFQQPGMAQPQLQQMPSHHQQQQAPIQQQQQIPIQQQQQVPIQQQQQVPMQQQQQQHQQAAQIQQQVHQQMQQQQLPIQQQFPAPQQQVPAQKQQQQAAPINQLPVQKKP